MKRLVVAALFALPLALPAPGRAQEDAGDRVNTLIVYGDDPCPPSTGNEIIVCARLAEDERYRIPPNLRESNSPENQSWTNRVLAFESVGNFGPLSCTPYGAGGELGCTAKNIEQAYAEKRQGSDVRFSQLIEQERQKRLAGIDAEAAETQARVEELERQYMERLKKEGQAEDAADAPPAAPEKVDPDKLAQPPGL